MSTVQEIKEAAAKLSSLERAEIARWLRELDASVHQSERERWRKDWGALVSRSTAGVGATTWKREDLYER